jgi:hypothetical protein
MPAVTARRHVHSPVLDPSENHETTPTPAAATSPRRRQHYSKANSTTAQASAAAISGAARREPWQDVEDQLQHFNFDTSTQTTRTERRRARRRHRPLQLSWPVAILGSLLLCQWVALLWLEGLNLATSRHASKLDNQIQDVRKDIEDTQADIAKLDASAHIGEWAQQRGWVQVAQDKFDDITKPMPLAAALTDDGVQADDDRAARPQHAAHAASARSHVRQHDADTTGDAAPRQDLDAGVPADDVAASAGNSIDSEGQGASDTHAERLKHRRKSTHGTARAAKASANASDTGDGEAAGGEQP